MIATELAGSTYRVELLESFAGYGSAYVWNEQTAPLYVAAGVDAHHAQALAATAYCVRFAFARVTRIK